MSITFDSITKGVYTVALFHDENKNGKLDKGKLNIPVEGYGFSNNVATGLGPPSYNEIKFYYSGKNKQITINMNYFKLPK
jgi:uncharacterized protein (DUF2141 family)